MLINRRYSSFAVDWVMPLGTAPLDCSPIGVPLSNAKFEAAVVDEKLRYPTPSVHYPKPLHNLKKKELINHRVLNIYI